MRLTRGSLIPVMVGIIVTVMVALVAGGTQATAADRTVLSSKFGKATSHIEGTFGTAGVVRGTCTPRRFYVEDDTLMAVGRLRATLVRGSGKVVGTTAERVRLPVSTPAPSGNLAAAAASCDILHLELGPLDLDLLGLEVHLDKVVLDSSPRRVRVTCSETCCVRSLVSSMVA